MTCIPKNGQLIKVKGDGNKERLANWIELSKTKFWCIFEQNLPGSNEVMRV